MPVDSFDYQIVHFLNQFCRKSEWFDKGVVVLANNTLLKGGLLMMLLWYEWFRPANNEQARSRQDVRLRIISALCGCFASMATVRALTKSFPFRPRPILDAANHLVPAFGLESNFVDNTNSFPSDHASLFYALVAGFFFISRTEGWLSLIYVSAAVIFPRVYLGWHYPGDILGGAFFGVFFVCMANMKWFRQTVSRQILSYADRRPQIFYPVFFLLTYQIATLFEGIRTIGEFIIHPYTM